jgi:hypothetical protein
MGWDMDTGDNGGVKNCFQLMGELNYFHEHIINHTYILAHRVSDSSRNAPRGCFLARSTQ